MLNSKHLYSYKTLVEVDGGRSSEIHFSRRSDGIYIISRCQLLQGGEKNYLRSSVTLTKDTALNLANEIIKAFNGVETKE